MYARQLLSYFPYLYTNNKRCCCSVARSSDKSTDKKTKPVKKPTKKPAVGKKPAAKKTAAKKPVTKKAGAPKKASGTKKSGNNGVAKSAGKKTPVKKPSVKNAPAKKTTAKKATSKNKPKAITKTTAVAKKPSSQKSKNTTSKKAPVKKAASKKASPKTPARKVPPKKTAAKPSSKKKGILLRLFIVFLVVAGGVVIYADAIITSKFDGKRWSIPAKVYSRALELFDGAELSVDQLRRELQWLNYRESFGEIKRGSFRQKGDVFEISSRGFDFWDGRESAHYVSLAIRNSKVRKLEVDGQRNEVVRLEPVLIGGIYPAHNEDRVLISFDQVHPNLVHAFVAV